MNTLKKFCLEFGIFIRKELAYYNLSKEEVEQECALVWYENKAIESLYLNNKKYQAFAMFRTALTRSASSFSIMGSTTKYKKQKEMEQEGFIKLIADDSYDIDDKILESIYIEKIKEIITPEEYSFIEHYYSYGMKSTARKFNISYSNTRVKAMRLVNKIKDRMGV
ncbi:MAG: hypothetical protein ACRCX2_13290 [Paraclostridium sp.]